MEKQWHIYVGTYSRPASAGGMGGGGEGIYSFKLDTAVGRLVSCQPPLIADNPSFLAADAENARLYAANELNGSVSGLEGAVSAYKIDQRTGALTLLDRKPTGGKDPCHVSIAPQGAYLLAANYSSGNFCIYKTEGEKIGKRCAFVQQTGKGLDPLRQGGPHTHSCTLRPDGRFLVVSDLGIDQLLFYYLQKDGTVLAAESAAFQCHPGSGPRLSVFHPRQNWIYAVNELSSSVIVLGYNEEATEFKLLQEISTVSDQSIENTGAHIQLSEDGRFLYASNRGEDSIAVFSIDEAAGTLIKVGAVSSGGKTPRHFAIAGEYLIAANQNSDNLVIFRIDLATGKLSKYSEIPVPTPVCVCPVPM